MVIERLSAQLKKEPLAVFSGEWVLNHRRPIVYLWLRADNCLYVGKSANGIVRPLSPAHHRLANIEPADQLVVFEMENDAVARRTEARLIRGLNPLLNGPPTGNDIKWVDPTAHDLRMRRARLTVELFAINAQINKREAAETARDEMERQREKDSAAAINFMIANPEYLSVKGAASQFCVPEKAVRRAVESGAIKSVRVTGRCVRLHPIWVAEWAHAHQQNDAVPDG